MNPSGLFDRLAAMKPHPDGGASFSSETDSFTCFDLSARGWAIRCCMTTMAFREWRLCGGAGQCFPHFFFDRLHIHCQFIPASLLILYLDRGDDVRGSIV
jgi:hypothetical protein